LLDGGFARGLERSKLGRVLFDRAADALFVGGEELEVAGLFNPGAALGEGGIDFGVARSGVGVVLKAESEDGVFEGAGAVEAPVVLGDGLGEGGFEGTDGGERLPDGVAVLLEGLPVFLGMDDDLASEAVAEGVERGTFFAFFGAGAGGELRVTGVSNSFEPIPFVIKARVAA